MVNLTFPHTVAFMIVGPEGAKTCIVTFIEKGEKLAIDALWIGKMARDIQAYDKLGEIRIVRYLLDHGIDINSLTAQDFGKDKDASKRAIDDFLHGK